MQQAHQSVGVVRALARRRDRARPFVCVVDESTHGNAVAVRAQALHREARPARRRRGRPGVLRRDEHRFVSRVRKPARRPRVTAPSPSRGRPRSSALLRLDGANRARAEDALELILRLHPVPVDGHQRVSFRGQSVRAVRAAARGKIVQIVRRNRRRRHLLPQLAERGGDLIHRVLGSRDARLLLLLLALLRLHRLRFRLGFGLSFFFFFLLLLVVVAAQEQRERVRWPRGRVVLGLGGRRVLARESLLRRPGQRVALRAFHRAGRHGTVVSPPETAFPRVTRWYDLPRSRLGLLCAARGGEMCAARQFDERRSAGKRKKKKKRRLIGG